MRVAFLKGPTGLGAAGLMNEKDHGKVWGKYDFQLYTTPDEITSKLINGELDFSAV
jgi:NitT/TauT family transport system substrate-binding protein